LESILISGEVFQIADARASLEVPQILLELAFDGLDGHTGLIKLWVNPGPEE